MKTGKWTYSGDVNMLDYGGKNIRAIGSRRYQIVELVNMDEACGRDNQGQSRYNVALRLVDLNTLSEKNIGDALSCCGIEDDEPSDDVLAEACDSYGCHAPLEQWNGNNARKLLRSAYAEAKSLLDSEQLKDRLQRPVNKIGSSAMEFMRGDFMPAVQRGCESGQADARIMAKMYGVEQSTIDNVRPADYLPYVFGYMAAMNGGTKETDPDTSPEYFRGYDRGLAVKAGTAPAPDWIKTAVTA
jgi:hypothetical protein